MPITEITPYLYISSRESTRNVEELKKLKIDLVINAIFAPFPKKALTKSDIPILTVPSVDSIITPIPMSVFKKSVKKALPMIQENGKVLVYCKRGVHRSVAIASCILISNGYSSEDAMKLIKSKRSVADPDAKYIKKRILKFEKLWNDGKI